MRLASAFAPLERRRRSTVSHPATQASRSTKAGAQALLLFGRWLRVSRRGVSMMNGCGCGFDLAIELGEVDELILDYLQQKFSKTADLKSFIGGYLAGKQKTGIQRLLEALASGDHKLQADDVLQLLNAVEVSVASIEENHA
jgi:hypothetical protein